MRHALACLLVVAFNAAAADNTLLRDLFLADQAARQAEPDDGDVLGATPKDLERQKAVLEQIAAGSLTTSAQDRAQLGVPPLAASRERIRKMNGA